jgi:hypothetical protein
MKEKSHYEVIKKIFEELFRSKGKNTYFEVTANGFSNKLKDQIPDNRHIIFSFLGTKGAKPDMTGFIEEKYSKKFIVVEIKNESIKLNHIYQLKKYVELFDARFAFLVSTKEIPAEVKKLSKVVLPLLWRNHPLPNLTLVHFDEDINEFVDWFPENPFEKDLYWRETW